MCCTWLAEIQDAKNGKKFIIWAPLHNFVDCIFATKARIDNRKKNLLNSNTPSTCSHNMANLRPTNSWDHFRSLRHPSKFQQVSRLAFVTAVTSLTGGQPNFVQCLAVSCTGTLYIHFQGLLSSNGILPALKFTLIQVLHSPILAALLHGTQAAAISQTLWPGTRNGITELSQRRHLYSAGQPSSWVSAHILVVNCFSGV